jgi:hypothetical protein
MENTTLRILPFREPRPLYPSLCPPNQALSARSISKNTPSIYLTCCTLAFLFLAVCLCLSGCATAPAPSPSPVASAPPAKTTDIHSKSGAQLWGERCGFCHNVRSPTSFSDAHWEVATMHMRVRANLTGEEQTKILEFLKSAN